MLEIHKAVVHLRREAAAASDYDLYKCLEELCGFDCVATVFQSDKSETGVDAILHATEFIGNDIFFYATSFCDLESIEPAAELARSTSGWCAFVDTGGLYAFRPRTALHVARTVQRLLGDEASVDHMVTEMYKAGVPILFRGEQGYRIVGG